MSITSITLGFSLSPPIAILTCFEIIALSLYIQQCIVDSFPGTIISGIFIIFSNNLPFHACRATSQRTLYLRYCTFVSNLLIFSPHKKLNYFPENPFSTNSSR